MLEWVAGAEFDRLLVDTVTATYPAHERDRFVEHFRGLLRLWVKDSAGLSPPDSRTRSTLAWRRG
ncbi:hypothetical protein AB0L65_04910 [Nonomuraea sp. NPDC052116]|uniref:hypothetical protein n=1 Tax=Nonomuraea sp. NPDC052116 TaxID=3155665 RepID=UPI00341D3072